MVSHLDEFSNATDSDIEGNNESDDMQSWELSDNELIAIMTSIPKGMVLDSDDESEKDQPSTSQPNIETKVEDEASPESEPVHEVFLRSGKVLPPRKPSDKDNGKQIQTENPLADEPVNKKDRVTAPLDKVDYNVVAHLKKIPALLSIFDALMLSPEIRESLVTALTEPEEYQVYFATEREVFTAVEGTHHGGINFSNDDLMLGTEDHNRPLYVTAMTNNTKLNRIFVDQGASVNLMPLKTLAKLRISPSQLNTDKVMLKGFNDQSEQALGSITIPLRFGKLKTEAKFHVIDVNTSYKALLGRPWIHENGMVPSTLHQCMKFCLNGAVGNIPGDAQPFAVHEIGLHEDALYYHTPIVSTSAKVNKPEISQEKPELNIQEKAALKHEPTKHHPVVFGRGGRGDRGRGRKNYNARIPPPITRHGVPIGLYFDSSDSSSDDCQYQFRQGRVMSYRGQSKVSLLLHNLDTTQSDKNSRVLIFDSSDTSGSDTNKNVKSNVVSHSSMVHVQNKETTKHKDINQQMSKLEISGDGPASKACATFDIGELHQIDADDVASVFYVPPMYGLGNKPIVFHSASIQNHVIDSTCNEDNDEIKEVDISQYFFPSVIHKSIEQQLLPNKFSDRSAKAYYKLWKASENGETETKRGLGYHSPGEEGASIASCRMVKHTSGSNTNETGKDEVNTDTDSDDSQIKEAPKELEEGVPSAVDDLVEINLGTEEEVKLTFISALLPQQTADMLKSLLLEFKDCFAWNYTEMPGLDPAVAVHRLAIQPDALPIKQSPRRMRLEIEEQVISETKKLIEADFVREEKYPTWLANVVPVRKKSGQIRVCIDFRDLNKACPKDDFPLPIPELMIDIASAHSMFSFMDGSSGYNQIKMAEDEQQFTAFRTPIGIFCYKVMPFGLKNAGATYQRAMTNIFDGLIHKQVECYVDDLVVKSKLEEDHLYDLRIVFRRLRQFNLKMNPLKCAFGVTAGKFLGFVVRHRGIEIDPHKIKAILEMPPPKSLTQLRSFQGKLAYLRRFISNLSGRCKPFSALMKKDTRFKWNDQCQQAFEDIKHYLSNPPVLAAPIPGRPLILYTAALDESVGALLAQINEEGRENALYYLSKRLIPSEINYPIIEKHCLALIFAVQKLRHYMLSHKIHLISRVNPLQYLMTRPTLSGRLARWSMVLLQFDITFVPQRAIKGQALADFLAAHPVAESSPLNDDLPDEQILKIIQQSSDQNGTKQKTPTWEMYFDGAASMKEGPNSSPNSGIGLVFVTPEGGVIRYAYSLSEPKTNNETEYEALIAGLELCIQMGIQQIQITGDSQLIINQVSGSFQILKPSLVPYHRKVMELLELISEVTLLRVPRAQNGRADSLAKLAKEMAVSEGQTVSVTVQHKFILFPVSLQPPEEDGSNSTPEHLVCTTDQESDWRQPFIDYLRSSILPNERSLANQIRKRALSYTFINDTLYRRAFDQMWLRCLDRVEAQKVMSEVHEGLCGAHQSGPKMKIKIKRMGYYWQTMTDDCIKFAKKCHACQIYSTVQHRPPNLLHPTVASWPFDSWGIDIVGPIDPPSSKGHRFILAATDYFSKWAEAVPLKEVKAENVLEFLRDHIVYRFGVPRRIISDNGSAFRNTKINRFVQRHKIDWRCSTVYYPQANGLAEAFNKTLVQLVKKLLNANKREWHEKLAEALWAYRTTFRSPTKCTPYALAFGTEAVLPLEVELPSLRIALSTGLTQEENAKLRFEELNNLDELRLKAQQNLQLYRVRMTKAHDRLVRPRSFRVGELVLVLRRPIVSRHRGGKFEPTWEGPYTVQKAYRGGAYQLVNYEGVSHPFPVNGRYLKKYHA